MFTVHVALRSTDAPTNYEYLRVARRLSITSYELPRYTTLADPADAIYVEKMDAYLFQEEGRHPMMTHD